MAPVFWRVIGKSVTQYWFTEQVFNCPATFVHPGSIGTQSTLSPVMMNSLQLFRMARNWEFAKSKLVVSVGVFGESEAGELSGCCHLKHSL